MKRKGTRLAALLLSTLIIGESVYSPLTAMGSVYATEAPVVTSTEEALPAEVTLGEGQSVEAMEADSDEQYSETIAENEGITEGLHTEEQEGIASGKQDTTIEEQEGIASVEQDTTAEDQEDITGEEADTAENSQNEITDTAVEETPDTWTDEQGNVYSFAGYETNENGDRVPVYNITSAIQTRKEAHGKSVRVARKFYATAPKSADYYRLYYNQLSDIEKGIYDAIKANYEGFKTNLDLQIEYYSDENNLYELLSTQKDTSLYSDRIFQAIAAFMYDHPEAYWLDVEDLCVKLGSYGHKDLYVIAKNGKSSNVYTDVYDSNASRTITGDFTEMEKNIAEIVKAIPQNGTIYEKTAVINDWLVNYNYYNRYVQKNYYPQGIENKLTNGHTAVAALTEQTWLTTKDDYGDPLSPVCESYAKAFKLVCDRVGIPCIVVSGADHMWNYVQDARNGKWYAVDVTWNDPVRTDEWNNKTTPSQWINAYLLVGSSTVIQNGTEYKSFITTHPANGAFWVGGQPFDTPTLEADAYANSVIITFDPNGGSFTNESDAKREAQAGDVFADMPVPTKIGYKFVGWYTDLVHGYKIDNGSQIGSKDYTLFARWDLANPITVELDTKGGDNLSDIVVGYQTNYGRLPNPERKGYTFKGWYTEEAYTNLVTENTQVTKGTNHTLYAKWEANKYTVTFDPGEGTVEEASREVTFGSNYGGALPTPTREGYSFDGWYTEAEAGSKVENTYTVDKYENFTLYAHWTINKYTISFEGDNIESITRDYGQNYGELPKPQRDGYSFLGWYIEGQDEDIVESTDIVKQSVTLKTKWEANKYTVTFNPGEGTVEEASREVTFDSNYGNALPTPTREGYSFDGWYTEEEAGSKIENTSIVNECENFTLYAHWTINKYTISFETNIPEYSIEDEKREHGDSYGELPVPNKTKNEGYDFLGWFIKGDDGDAVQHSDIVEASVTLEAKWGPKKFKIMLDANGGISDVAEVEVVYDSAYELPEARRVGYEFDGWYTEKQAGNKIEAKGKVNRYEDFTLYAHWINERQVNTPEIFIINKGDLEDSNLYYSSKIKITNDKKDALTYYTLDGSDPNIDDVNSEENNDGKTYLYEEEFSIGNNVETGTMITIKAQSFREDWAPSDVLTKEITLVEEPDNIEDIIDEDIRNREDFGYSSLNDIPDNFWILGVEDKVYTGKAIIQNSDDIVVFYGTKRLSLNTDYTIKYSNNVKAGDAVITITGKGSYTGVWKTNFKIEQVNIENNPDITLTPDKVFLAFNNKVQKATTTVKWGNITLKNKTDYDLVYEDERDDAFKASTDGSDPYKVKIVGKGNYTGTIEFEEYITECTLMSKLSYVIKDSEFDNGNPVEPSQLTVKNKKEELSGKYFDGVADKESILSKLTEEENKNYHFGYYITDNKEIGKASIVFVGNPVRRYMGDVTKTFNVKGKDFKKAKFEKAVTANVQWNGSEQDNIVTDKDDTKASVKYTVNKETFGLNGILKAEYNVKQSDEKREYDYVYSFDKSPVEIGTYTITFEGINGYTGTVSKKFKIVGTAISKAKVEGIATSYEYTGEPIEPAGKPDEELPEGIRVYIPATKTVSEDELIKGTDFTVSYQKNENAGTATIFLTGMGGYTGTLKKTFKITPYSILADNQLDEGSRKIEIANIEPTPYTKGGVTITPEITFKEKQLEIGKDFTVKYSANTKPGIATMTITGKGNFSKAIKKTFEITNSKLANISSITASDIVYKRSAGICKPTIKLVDSNGKALAAGTDYDKNIKYTYLEDTNIEVLDKKVYTPDVRKAGTEVGAKDVIPVGTIIKAEVTGIKNYSGKDGDADEELVKTVEFRFINQNISKASVKIPAQIYKGEGQKIELTKDQIEVKIGKELLKKTDYEIVQYYNNDKKGTATVELEGRGIYGGTKKATFKINARSLDTVVNFHSNYPNGAKEVVRAQKIQGDEAVLSANAFKFTGATFVGWSTEPIEAGTQEKAVAYENKGTVNVKEKDFKGETIDLYAVWQLQEYTITYKNLDGVNNNPEVTKYTVLDTVSLSDELEKTGYNFLGWYKDAKFKTKISQIKKGSTGNIVLYAKFN